MKRYITVEDALNAMCDNCDSVQAVCPHYPCKQYKSIEQLPSAQPDYDLSGYSDRLWKSAYERGKAEAEPRWIPVTERLPEDGQNVLVTVEGWYKGNMFERDIDLATYSPYGGYIDGFDTVNDWIEYGEWKATAWMPLPEPYREEK